MRLRYLLAWVLLFCSAQCFSANFDVTVTFYETALGKTQQTATGTKQVTTHTSLIDVINDFKLKVNGKEYWSLDPDLWRHYYGQVAPELGFDPFCEILTVIIQDGITSYTTQRHDHLTHITQTLSFPDFLPEFIKFGARLDRQYEAMTGKKLSALNPDLMVALKAVQLLNPPGVLWPFPREGAFDRLPDMDIKAFFVYELYQHWLSTAGFHYPARTFLGFVPPEVADDLAARYLFSDHLASFHWCHGSLSHLLGVLGSKATADDIRVMVDAKTGKDSHESAIGGLLTRLRSLLGLTEKTEDVHALWGHLFDVKATGYQGYEISLDIE